MKEFLAKMIGRKVDVLCGRASSVRGEILKVDGGVLHLKDPEGRVCYVAIEKISIVWEAKDDDHRAGFVSPLNNK